VKHTIFLAPMLCISLLFSCTIVERDNPFDSGGKNYSGGTSSVVPSGCKNAGSSYSCSMKGYKIVEIGGKTWMAENLNCDVEGSYCNYGYDENYNRIETCNEYGRLYDWCTAMAVCPIGWHLPSNDEWQELVDFAGGNYVAGKYLKAKDGWADYDGEPGNGEDKFGFSALPGGMGDYYSDDIIFTSIGYSGNWWGSTEVRNLPYAAYFWGTRYESESFTGGSQFADKSWFLSVRCIKN